MQMWSRRLDYLVYFAALSRVPWTDAGHMCMSGTVKGRPG